MPRITAPFDLLFAGLAPWLGADRVPAQQPEPVVVPAATASREAAGATLAFDLPDWPIVDVDGEAVRVFTKRWKAGFDHGGLEFVPFLGHDAPRNEPVRFTVGAALLGSEPMAITPALPRLESGHVVYEHGALVADYEILDDGLEQSFAFAWLPTRGELAVDLRVETALRREADGRGFVFAGARGGVRYSGAVAIDAAGRRIEIATEPTADGLRLVVPAAFVATAELPLVIDPLVGAYSTVALNSGNRTVYSLDLAYEGSTDRHLAVVHWEYSQTDVDCFAYLLDGSLQRIGSPITIDFSTNSWESPHVAANNAADSFLVVAQVSTNRTSPFWIGGRIVAAATGATSVPFDVERAGLPGHFSGDKLRPDVGGDGNPNGPGDWLVVWERAFSATDHDVHCRQVTATGALRTTSATLVDNSLIDDRNVAISKSNGNSVPGTQCWAVAFERSVATGNGDVRGAVVDRSGQVRTFGGQTSFAVGSAVDDEDTVKVSSPTADAAGQRLAMFTFRRGSSPFTSSSQTRVFDLGTGSLLAGDSRSGAQNLGIPVDTDGCRFATVTAFLPWVRATTWAYVAGTGLVVQDQSDLAIAGVGFSGFAAIASHYSGGGSGSSFAIGGINGANTGDAYFQHYGAYAAAGGFATRTTACGTEATIGWYGTPALGEEVVVYQFLGVGLRGYVFGTPANVALPFCSGCTIGVQGSTVMTDPLTIAVPCRVGLVGTRFSLQGFHFGAGPCLSAISLSDTLDLTIR